MKVLWSILISIIAIHDGSIFGPPSPITSPILEHTDIIDGITLVAPPRSFPKDPMIDIKNVGAGWISTVPYGFTRLGTPSIRYNLDRQWWGERSEGIEATIDYAHKNGIKVMLKPQIWSPDGWIGHQKFDSEKDWLLWEKAYFDFIMFYVQIAEGHQVDMLCIGTELKEHLNERPAFFKNLISEIRELYCGKLIYSANWDSFDQITIWEDLDYIGLSAYFPLDGSPLPEVENMINKWKPICKKLRKVSEKFHKKIVFTEFGYLSVDGAGGKTWELEKNVNNLNVNEKAQANCYDALFTVFNKESYWAGGFLWKWFPFGQGGEGYNHKDYTPQDKEAEKVLKKWYHKW